MGLKGIFKRAACVAFAAGIMSTGLLIASSTTSGASTPTTATWAETPNATPNYIFPYMSLAFFSVSNINQFQELMYRPLYWFGNGSTPDLNPSLSVADQPKYGTDSKGNTTVEVSLKGWKWNNGETVSAGDVMFWMNMMHAQKAGFAGYAPGTLPDNVSTITVNSPTEITFDLNTKVNSYWFTYNQLSEITPMPNAWNVTSLTGAPGSGGCSFTTYGTTDAQCTAVYNFLSEQSGYNPANPNSTDTSGSFSTYATSSLWHVVDGPWTLSHFDASGNISFVPNPSYSGPVKPTLTKFSELPYTSEPAEFNALAAGQVNVGFLPIDDVTSPTSNALKAGENNSRLSNFTLAPLYTWSINYFPYNFNSSGDGGNAGKIFSQLYVRQAIQYLVDQPLYISKISKGYGVGTYGPVPVEPANPFASKFEENNPYKYSPSKAKSLLTSHGWKVVTNGTSTCQKPGSGSGECGAGIPKGAKLAFNLQYANTSALVTNTMNAEKSSWAQDGINVSISSASFDTVIGNAVPCKAGSSGCGWELQNWGAGWVFAPDYYPTGEEIFQTGAGSNSGSYSDKKNDQLILATNKSNVSLTAYENYLATQLPVIYQPNYVTALTEIQHGLDGVTPQSPLWAINPENWRWK
jgi:peptide/nickel transport system substrate-binding protein